MKTKKTFSMAQEFRAICTELFGTFALTFAGAGAAAIAITSPQKVDFIARVAAPGLIVMAIIYAFGNISGAHINPAVTLAFALRRAFSWRRVPAYLIAQLLGATLAAVALQLLLGKEAHLGAPLPHTGLMHALIMEMVLTTFLVTVVIGTATGSKIVGSNAGIAVSGTIVACGILGATISGASMNPALSFGTLLTAGKLHVYWIYVLGPLCGSLFAVILNYLTHGKPTKHELETASGKPNKTSPPKM